MLVHRHRFKLSGKNSRFCKAEKSFTERLAKTNLDLNCPAKVKQALGTKCLANNPFF
jgi:hypothetical protein